MTDKEVFDKAIEIAKSKGLHDFEHLFVKPIDVIRSNDFAKAFWGEQRYVMTCCGRDSEVAWPECIYCGHNEPAIRIIDGWQYHLKKMSLKENSIDYLRKFVEP